MSTARREWAKTAGAIVMTLIVGMVIAAVIMPSGRGAAQSAAAVDNEGIAHGSAGHNHAEMLARQQAQAEPLSKPTKIADPAAPPEADEDVSLAGCLRGYGDGGQCIPAAWPGPDGTPKPVTCEVLADIFPKGFRAAKGDPAKLDTNGDKVACGAGD